MLDDLDIIDYKKAAKMVSLNYSPFNHVNRHMEPVQQNSVFRTEYNLVIASIGLLLVIATEMGFPIIATVGPYVWAGLTLLLIGTAELY